MNRDARSEKEKMLRGELYRGSDPELVAEQIRAQQLLGDYNASDPSDRQGRRELLEQLFGSMGEHVVIRPAFFCDYGYNIHVGDNLFVNFNCVFLDCAPITIGDDVQVGPAVQIYTADHPVDPYQRRSGLECARPVTIGDNVWIGGGAIVLPGVSVGNDAVIGAGSVVTRDVPAGTIVFGNPAQVRREL